MTSPVGLAIDKSGKWTIGRKIGSGAQGSVHELLKNGNKSEWVAKLAARPAETNKKKGKPSVQQRNADSIFYESLLYQSHFPQFRGKFIPRVPSMDILPVLLRPDGYNILVLEAMQSSFYDMIKSLPRSVNFTPIVHRIFDIFHAFHDMKRVIVDVKPENFMLAPHKGKSVETMAAAIRLLDLAMIENMTDPVAGTTKSNEGTADVQGTPLYASRNIHNLESPSRRDDIESGILIIAEMFIMHQAKINGTASKYEKNNDYLPWAREKSVQAIGAAKTKMIGDPNSEFYQRMPVNVAKAVFAALSEVKKYTFKQKPDYDKLKGLLSVTISATGADTAAFKSPRRGKRDKDSSESEAPPRKRKATVQDEAEPMDIDSINDDDSVEIIDPPANNPSKGSKDGYGIRLEITAGPHKGEAFELVHEEMEQAILGSGTKRAGVTFSLKKDGLLEKKHLEVYLFVRRNHYCCLRVRDLGSGSTVDGKELTKGDATVMPGKVIKIGQTTINVVSFGSPASKSAAKAKIPEDMDVDSLSSEDEDDEVEVEAEESKENKPEPSQASLALKIVSGPSGVGNRYVLDFNGTKSCYVGTKPKGADGIVVNDPSLKSTHAHFEIHGREVRGRMESLKIMVTGKGGDTFINDKRVTAVKGTAAFKGGKIRVGGTTFLVEK